MAPISAEEKTQNKHQGWWKSSSRASWTPYMRQKCERLNTEYARYNLLLILYGLAILRIGYITISLISGHSFGWSVVSTFLVGIPAIICLRKNKLILPMRYGFSPLLRIISIPFITNEISSEGVGFICGLFFMLLMIESIMIIRHFKLEIVYIVFHGVLLSLWISTVNFQTDLASQSYLVIFLIAAGCICCSWNRRQIETAMFEARYKSDDFSALIAQLQVGIVAVCESKILLINEKCRTFVQKFQDSDNYNEDDLHSLLLAFEKRFTSPQHDEFILFRNYEDTLCVRVCAVNYYGNPAKIYVLTDISETEKSKRELERLDQYKTNLIRTVSHDYRTPLNVIVNGLDILTRDAPLSGKHGQVTKVCREASRYLLYLVNDLLDYYQLKTHAFQKNIQKFDIQEALVSILELVSFKTQTSGVSLVTDFSSDLPCDFHNDSDRIKQVIINLVTNAIKYSSRDSEIRVRATVNDQKEVIVEVKDHGIGIKPEDQTKLFKEFGRIVDDEHITLNPKGVGLGLWICKGVCDELGSGIEVDSIYGEGTTFRFTLRNFAENEVASEDGDVRSKGGTISGIIPYDHDDTETARRVSSLTRQLPRMGNPFDQIQEHPKMDKTVLIVDDESFNQIVLEQLLSRFNIVADVASNGSDALNLVEENPYQILIIDYDMPKMSGPDLIKRIRQKELQWNRLGCTIFGHTAFGEKERQELLESGANEILNKPTSIDQVSALLSRYKVM